MFIRQVLGTLTVISSFFVLPSVFSLEATYYADAFEGGGTANGDRFSQAYHSAALCNEEL